MPLRLVQEAESNAGLIDRAAQAPAAQADLAVELLHELLEIPVTGHTVSRIAALKLASCVAAAAHERG